MEADIKLCFQRLAWPALTRKSTEAPRSIVDRRHPMIGRAPQRKPDIVTRFGWVAALLFSVRRQVGAVEAATSFPRIRAGTLALAGGFAPAKSGLTLVTIGRLTGAATLGLVIAALVDFALSRRWLKWAGTVMPWRVALGLMARLLPIAILLSLPWSLQLAVGRAFSFAAVFLAMLDMTVGLALVGTILAATAIFRLSLILQGVFWPTDRLWR